MSMVNGFDNLLMAQLKEAGIEWSHYRRYGATGWPRCSVLGRIREMGPAASDRQKKTPDPPYISISMLAALFQRVYVTLCEENQAILYICYVERGKPSEKAKLLSCSTSTMYRKRNDALKRMIPGWVEALDSSENQV